MDALITDFPALVAADPSVLAHIRKFDAELREMPQTEIPVDHLLHAGMYARTVCIPSGNVVSGVLLRRATLLIVSGDVTLFTGVQAVRLVGYHVLPGSAARKQLFRTHADTCLTMVLPSRAQSIDDAEHEFTSEPELLMRSSRDTITITGEEP